jgi:Na+/H+-dicarboxylate symporter
MASKDTNNDHETHEEAPIFGGCGPLKNYPVLTVIMCAAVGIGVGVGLSFWEPENGDVKAVTLQWLGLVGDMFIRALKCVVLPLVFVNVIISVVDMMSVGKASAIGGKTVLLYIATTVGASIFSTIASVSFKGKYGTLVTDSTVPPLVALECTADMGMLAQHEDGSVSCTTDYDEQNTYFEISDMNEYFVKRSAGPGQEISLSDTIYDGVFGKLITDNIISAFMEGNFAAIVIFAICFGIAFSAVLSKMKNTQSKNALVEFLESVNAVLIQLIGWIVLATPVAVLSLVSNALGSQDDLPSVFRDVGYLVVTVVFGMLLHILFVHFGLFYLITKTNPASYLKFIIPAQTTAFACASSAATLPVTIRCVKSSGRVPTSIVQFVLPLGATINMDGSAIHFLIACIWMAVLNGEEVTAASYILLIIITTIGSAGAAPVPSSGLVLILTAYNTTFNTVGVPNGFQYIVAIDWLLDRFDTMLNVTGDSMVAAMVSHMCPMEDIDHTEDYLKGEGGQVVMHDATNITKHADVSSESEEAA